MKKIKFAILTQGIWWGWVISGIWSQLGKMSTIEIYGVWNCISVSLLFMLCGFMGWQLKDLFEDK